MSDASRLAVGSNLLEADPPAGYALSDNSTFESALNASRAGQVMMLRTDLEQVDTYRISKNQLHLQSK